MITLGVLSDTHIPDQAKRVNPVLTERFRKERVEAILHAGDVCVPSILGELESLAPVHAVKGNRDWFRLSSLPHHLILQYCDTSIVLTHGHSGLCRYIVDKARYLREGLEPERYIQRIVDEFPAADVIVFGHIHVPINRKLRGKLVLNPGSACCPHESNLAPSAALLKIQEGGKVCAEIFPLE
jgi:putative phosphoesterase